MPDTPPPPTNLNLTDELRAGLRQEVLDAIKAAGSPTPSPDMKWRLMHMVLTAGILFIVSGGGMKLFDELKEVLDVPAKIASERVKSDERYQNREVAQKDLADLRAIEASDTKALRGLLDDAGKQRDDIRRSLDQQNITLARFEERLSGIQNTLNAQKTAHQ